MEPKRRAFLGGAAVGVASAVAGCLAPLRRALEPRSNSERVDDWQYSPPKRDGGWGGGFLSGGGNAVSLQGSADAGATTESIGLAAGGAADVSTFRRNVEEGYLPIPESMTDEGLFYDYAFDTGGDGSCSSLFCPTYTPAVSPDPLSGETERYLTVGLDSGLSQADFERPTLNLVIVLDISGSMRSSFDRYYYDQHGNRREVDEEQTRPKMAVAKDALVSLTEQLRPEDRLGVVLFNNAAAVAKPLRTVETTDMDAIRGHIQEDIRAGGGTNVSAGLDEAEALMAEYEGVDADAYENRTIVLTDAQINLGQTNAEALRTGLAENADAGHHTTVVGIGVDFNADLVEQLTSIRGANYYSVHSEDEFERRMGEEFAYMVTPLVYDLSLSLDAEGYEIAQVYGSNAADEATGELMGVHTLFPSPKSDGEARGGVVLVKLRRTDSDAAADDLTLEASWTTRSGAEESTTETVALPAGDDEHYGNDAVRKAILLARYATLLKNWTVAERDPSLVGGDGDGGAGDEVSHDDSIGSPPDDDQLGQWELQSDPLTVTDPYESRIRDFREHFAGEVEAIGDDELERELELMETILASA